MHFHYLFSCTFEPRHKKTVIKVSDHFRHKRWAAHPQKMPRGLKFLFQEVEGLYYPCSENKGADQLPVTAKLICVFVFAYAKTRFSHDVVHFT